MGIFNLSTPVDNTAEKVVEDNTDQNNKEDTKDAITMIINSKDNKVSPDNETNEMNSDNNDQQEKTVIMKGPLSKVFAEALQNTLSKEDSSIQSVIDYENASNSHQEASDESLYVYCVDGDILSQDDLVNATNDLKISLDDKCKKIVLATECKKVNSKISLLNSFCMKNNIPVCIGKESAIDYIKNFKRK